ncbi:hypothetical protein D917_08335 [Trichinella nativa]|uniref:Uncharacterized protein n=1 Tax=Trichinella nativa TaxID=6335 RepID=A0A1Y3EKL1_9BILA|nr:hypothetical protein D917_08335 [Trichinella nativa]
MIDQQSMIFVNCVDNNRRKNDDEKHHLEKKVLKKVPFTCTRHDSDQQKPIAHDDVDIEDDNKNNPAQQKAQVFFLFTCTFTSTSGKNIRISLFKLMRKSHNSCVLKNHINC